MVSIDTPRMRSRGQADPCRGAVRWQPKKSIWITTWTAVALLAGPSTISWDAVAVLLALGAVTLCAGHSVGKHRLLIHRSFDCPRWLERVLVYLGVLVGMAGPVGMMRQHDIRDWAQRQRQCHSYLRHGEGFWRDYFWQCHCDIVLDQPPAFMIEPRVRNDKVLMWLERTWMVQQLPLALLLFALGGWSLVVWGIGVRVAVSVTGHWMVGHFAHHNYGDDDANIDWRLRDVSVQGRNVAVAGLISMGEAWHNNHHAFPQSARLGLERGQIDLGWWLIRALTAVGLAWNVTTPEKIPARANLVRVSRPPDDWAVCRLRKRLWAEWFGYV